MITWILAGIALLVLLFVLLSPLESLRWWANKGERELTATFDEIAAESQEPSAAQKFVVYLSGVGVLAGDQLSGREMAWLSALEEDLPECQIVADVFPYAVDNRGLLARATMRLWRILDWTRRQWRWNPIHLLINIRNIAQVLVSADPRYGPTFNIGLAQELWRSLQRHGYRRGSGVPVVLIGYSGVPRWRWGPAGSSMPWACPSRCSALGESSPTTPGWTGLITCGTYAAAETASTTLAPSPSPAVGPPHRSLRGGGPSGTGG